MISQQIDQISRNWNNFTKFFSVLTIYASVFSLLLSYFILLIIIILFHSTSSINYLSIPRHFFLLITYLISLKYSYTRKPVLRYNPKAKRHLASTRINPDRKYLVNTCRTISWCNYTRWNSTYRQHTHTQMQTHTQQGWWRCAIQRGHDARQ